MNVRGERHAEPMIAALAAGASFAEAGRAAGLSERTVRRRWRDAQVRREVAELRAAALARAVGVLSDGAADAAAFLVGVARGEQDADVRRIAAARAVLTLAPVLRDAVELEERVAVLEAAREGESRGGSPECQA